MTLKRNEVKYSSKNLEWNRPVIIYRTVTLASRLNEPKTNHCFPGRSHKSRRSLYWGSFFFEYTKDETHRIRFPFRTIPSIKSISLSALPSVSSRRRAWIPFFFPAPRLPSFSSPSVVEITRIPGGKREIRKSRLKRTYDKMDGNEHRARYIYRYQDYIYKFLNLKLLKTDHKNGLSLSFFFHGLFGTSTVRYVYPPVFLRGPISTNFRADACISRMELSSDRNFRVRRKLDAENLACRWREGMTLRSGAFGYREQSLTIRDTNIHFVINFFFNLNVYSYCIFITLSTIHYITVGNYMLHHKCIYKLSHKIYLLLQFIFLASSYFLNIFLHAV
ncbi:hypothetical protein PUN28_007440 [Cardiocondyla obscurior]|uniref:Ribosomal protein S3 n=1 Tax=Cardiocondyla obscurior TaxID=286306 RepID=A0AAW2G4Z1_9HYME